LTSERLRSSLVEEKCQEEKESDNNNTNNNNNNNKGLVQIEAAYKAEIINIAEYRNTNYKEEQFVNIVKNHENTKPNMNSIIKTATKITEELSQPNEKSDAKQDGIEHTEARLRKFLKKLKNKVMQGEYIRNIDRQLISKEDAFLWVSKGDQKGETESEIVAARDQALQTKYYATKILDTERDSRCRLCQQLDETTDHIISACPILAKEQYIKRRDCVCVCVCVCTTALQHTQGNRGKIGLKTPV